jgi:hypothetical protein
MDMSLLVMENQEQECCVDEVLWDIQECNNSGLTVLSTECKPIKVILKQQWLWRGDMVSMGSREAQNVSFSLYEAQSMGSVVS